MARKTHGRRAASPVEHTISRRTWLKLVGATGATASFAGVASATEEPDDGVEIHGIRFGTVVNMVEAGADPTGEEPIDPILEAHAKDDTLLYFPEGRYKLHQFRNYEGTNDDFEADLYYGLENFGLLGAGSGRTELVPRDGQGSAAYGTGYFHRLWFELRYGRNYLVKGFSFDYTAENTGGRFQLLPDGDFVMRDVRVRGENDVQEGPLLFSVLDPDATGLVRDVRLPDGGGSTSFGPTGIYVSKGHQGTVTLRDCVVEGFPDNGLYASNPSDPAAVEVIGGRYANNNISQVRLGTSRSFVKNARVEATEAIEVDGPVNMRGIRVADGSGVEIDNCDVVVSADAYSSGAIVGNHYAGDFSVKNTRIRTDAPYERYAVYAKSTDVADSSVTLENLSITGDSPGRMAVVIKGRDPATLSNVCVQQTGADRDGVTLVDTDATIEESVLNVTGDPIVTIGDSEVETSNVRYDGTCPVPRPE